MKRFRFRLETALRVRRLAEQQALASLAEAERGVVAAEAALTEALDEHEGNLEYCGRLQAQRQPDMALLYAASCYTLILEENVVLKRQDVWQAHQFREERREVLQHCRQAREALDKLREKAQQEHREEASAEEQAWLDEAAVLRWGRA